MATLETPYSSRPDAVTGVSITASETVLLANPPVSVAKEFIAELAEGMNFTLHLLVTDEVIRELKRDFPTAATMSELVSDGLLEIKTLSEPIRQCVTVIDDEVVQLLAEGDSIHTAEVSDTGAEVDLADHHKKLWNAGTDYEKLRTPSLSSIYDSLADELSPAVSEAFKEFLDDPSTNLDGDGLDAVNTVLIIGAYHDKLFYDIGTWGEMTGFASRATFSREKKILEENDLIETEKERIDIGRPRQRLKLHQRTFSSSDSIAYVLETAQEDLPN